MVNNRTKKNNRSRIPRRTIIGATIGGLMTLPLSSTGTRAQTPRTPWTVELGDHGPPTVVDNTVYVTYSNTEDQSDEILSIDAGTGEKKWTFPVEGEFVGTETVTVVDGLVFAATSSNLYAIDADNGKKLWKFSPDNDSFKFVSSPMVANKNLYAIFNKGIFALNAETARNKWIYEIESEKVYNSISKPIVSDNILYSSINYKHEYGGSHSKLFALGAETGEEQWAHKFEKFNATTPLTLADDSVFYSLGKYFYIFDAKTGEIQNTPDGGYDDNDDTTLLLPYLRAPYLPDNRFRALTVSEDTLYCEPERRMITSVDIDRIKSNFDDSMRVSWRIDTGGDIDYCRSTVAEGMIFTGNTSEAIYGFTLDRKPYYWYTTGGLIPERYTRSERQRKERDYWSFEVGENVESILVVEGTIYASTDTSLYAVDAPVDKSSNDSHVLLGQSNHHGKWRHADQSISIPQDVIERNKEQESITDKIGETSEELPGFAIKSSLAALGSAGYMLRLRINKRKSE
jgi:outer membrane protein assembly factor BamB